MKIVKARETQAKLRKVKAKAKMVVKRMRERKRRERMCRHRLEEDACESNLVNLIQTVMLVQQMRAPVANIHIRERMSRNQVTKRRAVIKKSRRLLGIGERLPSRIVMTKRKRKQTGMVSKTRRKGSIGATYSLQRNEISLMSHQLRRLRRKLKRSPRLQLQTCLRGIEG